MSKDERSTNDQARIADGLANEHELPNAWASHGRGVPTLRLSARENRAAPGPERAVWSSVGIGMGRPMRKWHVTAGELLWPVCIVPVLGWFADWNAAQTLAFAIAVVSFVYAMRAWTGAEVAEVLRNPLVAVPVTVLLCFLLWYSHYGEPRGHARPISFSITAVMFAPYFALALFRILKLE